MGEEMNRKKKIERPAGETHPILPGEGRKRGGNTVKRSTTPHPSPSNQPHLRRFIEWGFSKRDLDKFSFVLIALEEDCRARKVEIERQLAGVDARIAELHAREKCLRRRLL